MDESSASFSALQQTGRLKRKVKKLKNEPSSVLQNECPDSVQVFDYVTARAKEFSSMMNAIQNKGGSKRTFQKLPRHIRRRAMSFNIRRLPWKQREMAALEMDEVAQAKRPSRHRRRKPKNLYQEYRSRQHSQMWLETHIWHAKRMKMVNKWGYRLAEESCAKSIRVNYRYMKKGCLVSDISYYCCIEVDGDKSNIMNKLSCLFPSESDFNSSEVLKGLREAFVMMYYPFAYPYNCIGPVWILWQPVLLPVSKLWVWCHPSIHKAVLTILTSLVDGVGCITDLKDKLLRFRLIGQQSLPVLMSILHPARIDVEPDSYGLKYLENLPEWKEISATTNQRQWWLEKMTDNHDYDVLKVSKDNFSSGTAIPLVTQDPRLVAPSKRQNLGCSLRIKEEKTLSTLLKEIDVISTESNNVVHAEETNLQVLDVPKSCDELHLNFSSPSFLFDETIREAASVSKIHDNVINNIRGKFFLKPQEVSLGSETNHIPVILIKRTYFVKPEDEGDSNVIGWDLVLPHNWGMAFWIGLIYQGVRPCGMKELLTCCNLECLQPCFPFDFPDTFSGQEEQRELKVEQERQYERYPPDKRPNFGKLRIASPFDAQWLQLFADEDIGDTSNSRLHLKRRLSDAAASSDVPSKKLKVEVNSGNEETENACVSKFSCSFYVMRSSLVLKQLIKFQEDLVKSTSVSSDNIENLYADMMQNYGITSILCKHRKSLLTVSFEIANSGKITAPSIISLPLIDDLVNFKSNVKYSGPIEPLAPRGVTFVEGSKLFCGEYDMTRKEMKVLKQKRKRANVQKIPDGKATEELARPIDEVFQLISSPTSRDVIGYISNTVGYRHMTGRFSAIGHCTLVGWIELCHRSFEAQLNGVVCLLRGHTQQYRLAYINIVEVL